MQVNVLGPLAAWHNGVSVVPTAWKPRQVMALLAVRASQLVPVSTLIEELWGPAEPPRSAIQVVQTYILRLRQRIAATSAGDDGAKQIVATGFGGYMLNIAPEAVDVHRFHKLAQAGEQALESGDYQSASDLLGAALDSWRGPILVDVRIGSWLSVEVERLRQTHLGVLESRIDADLGLGRHHQVLGELAELTARYPLHEKLCEQYMTALHRCGCKWRALEVFRRLRGRLVDELGVEPSVRVQHVQRAILNSDTRLDAVGPQLPAPLEAAG